MADPHPVLVEALRRLALSEGLAVDAPSARASLLAVANADARGDAWPDRLAVDVLAGRIWAQRRALLVGAEVLDLDGRPVEHRRRRNP